MRVGVGLAVVVIVVAAGLGVRWWTHPTLFRDLGDTFIPEPRAVSDAALSTTVIFPQVDGEAETVTIDELQATFSANTAEATVTFSICHLQPGEEPILAVSDPTDYCGDIEPFGSGAPFEYGVASDSDYLFVTITPTRAGMAHLERVEVRYSRAGSHLYQRGTESIRVDRRVRAN